MNKIHLQIEQCIERVEQFRQLLHERRWNSLIPAGETVASEMGRLRSILPPEGALLEGDALERMRYLEIQMRRCERQLRHGMEAVNNEIDTLETGIRKVDKSRSLLQRN